VKLQLVVKLLGTPIDEQLKFTVCPPWVQEPAPAEAKNMLVMLEHEGSAAFAGVAPAVTPADTKRQSTKHPGRHRNTERKRDQKSVALPLVSPTTPPNTPRPRKRRYRRELKLGFQLAR
jgi:hypothetical protein